MAGGIPLLGRHRRDEAPEGLPPGFEEPGEPPAPTRPVDAPSARVELAPAEEPESAPTRREERRAAREEGRRPKLSMPGGVGWRSVLLSALYTVILAGLTKYGGLDMEHLQFVAEWGFYAVVAALLGKDSGKIIDLLSDVVARRAPRG